ncbi:hypothetical protein D3Y59_00265 [Hymenobacter oligotrophus]|uniref:Uncharacterized protein n=1 Tax=Hymenobacter oligotrophus TaxID=2319843 RepID=A0A3B7QWD7_9BACT|nr:hypothetical protein [Hymenobacter oligotrophus]AYA35622.1 hypothetical protein D3Y59_00265 [Hymenobacter oligotrophus]
MTHKTKWLVFAPSGLVVIGLGVCLIQWASKRMQDGAATKDWVMAGTVALGVFNAGVSLFGRGVAESVLYQLKEKPSKEASPAKLPQD